MIRPGAIGASAIVQPFLARSTPSGPVFPERTLLGTAGQSGAPLLSITLPGVTIPTGAALLVGFLYDNAIAVDFFEITVDATMPTGTAQLLYGVGFNLAANVAWFDPQGFDVAGDLLIDFSGSSGFPLNACLVAILVSDLKSPAIDRTKTAAGGPSTTQDSGLTAATAQAKEFVWGIIGTDGVNTDTIGTWQAGMAAGANVSAGGVFQLKEGFQSVNAVSTYRAEVLGGTSRRFGAICITFKAF